MAKKETENETRERKPRMNLVLSIFLIIAILASGFAIYEIFLLNSIETLIRYIIIGVLILIDVVLFF